MFSSPMLLSASTVFALLGLALVTIAALSDNWIEYQVDRKAIQGAMSAPTIAQEVRQHLKEHSAKDMLYFTRTFGLFHICFPEQVPSEIGSFSKFGTPCIANPDYFPDSATKERYSALQIQRLWFMRATALSFLAGLVIIALCLLVGIVGCYKRSASITRATAIFLFFAVLFLLIAVSLWHYVNYMERRVLEMHPYYRSWEPTVKQTTRINFGWSYVVAWVGVGFLLFAAIFLLLSWRAIKTEEERIYESKHAAYFQQYYDKSIVPISYGGGAYGGGYGGYYPPASYFSPQYHPSSYGYGTYMGGYVH